MYFICDFEKAWCGHWNALERIDKNRIIVGGEYSIIVISLIEKKIIESIDNEYRCNGIKVFENKGIFLVSGWNTHIKIFKCENYQFIKIIKYAHDDNIVGFIILNDNSITSYGCDKIIKVWSVSIK